MAEDPLALSADPFGSLYERNMNRTNEIIDTAISAIKNASLPPTFKNLNDLVQSRFPDFTEDDAETLVSLRVFCKMFPQLKRKNQFKDLTNIKAFLPFG